MILSVTEIKGSNDWMTAYNEGENVRKKAVIA
jgi:hypothetical protein